MRGVPRISNAPPAGASIGSFPLQNPYTQPIPQPAADLNNLSACVMALKLNVESLTGQRGNRPDRAVLFTDLVEYGLLSPGAVKSSNGTFVGGGGLPGPPGPEGPPGPPGQSASVLDYRFDTSTAAGPANGRVRLNNATPSAATLIYVANITDLGNDASALLGLLDAGYEILIQDSNDATEYYAYTVTGPSVALTGYQQIPVTWLKGSGSLANNASILFTIVARGPAGSYQIGPGLKVDSGTTPPTIDVTTPYLPLTGGTVSGNLTVSGSTTLNIATAATPTISDNSTRVATTAFVKGQGFLTGNQAITLTGDVTGSGATSITATVAALQGRAVATVAPTSGQVLGWSGSAWTPTTLAAAGASVIIGPTPPPSPKPGDLWWDDNDGVGQLFVYFTDADSSQWIIANSGLAGPKGDAATVAVGTTTTGAPGSNASVTNSGSSAAAVFNFTIPQGAQGVQGPVGNYAAVISDTPPPSPTQGTAWWDSTTGQLYIYFIDPSGPPGQWIAASQQGPQGPQGAPSTVPGPQGPSGAGVGYNKFHNPFCEIDQQYEGTVGVTLTSSAPYILDGIKASVNSSSAVMTSARNTTAPPGYSYSLWVNVNTAASSVAAGDYAFIRRMIEADELYDTMWGTVNAVPVTISFWASCTIPGTYYLNVMNGAANRSYVAPFTINAANVFQLFAITIPGDTSGGAWTISGNNAGMYVHWSPYMGTTFQTSNLNAWQNGTLYSATGMPTTFMTTAGAGFRLGPHKLELGSVATPIQRDSFQRELQRCQRYYEKSYDVGVKPGTARSAVYYCGFMMGVATGGNTNPFMTGMFKVTKRAATTFTQYDGAGTAGNCGGYTGSSWVNGQPAQSIYQTGTNMFTAGSSNLAVMCFDWTADCRL